MSFITVNKFRQEFLISAAYSETVSDGLCFIINSENPKIAFIGVRISWDMFAKNTLLDWLAASASCFASSKLRNVFIRSDKSVIMIMYPIISL